MNWTAESFHQVSGKILTALGDAEKAEYHSAQATQEQTERLQSKFAV